MEDTLISYETAKLAKELRYDKGALAYYSFELGENKEIVELNYSSGFEYMKSCTVKDLTEDFNSFNTKENMGMWNRNDIYFSAPTQSLLQKWLREIHKIHIVIGLDEDGYIVTLEEDCDDLEDREITEFDDFTVHNTYEEALEVGLYEALKLIKNE